MGWEGGQAYVASGGIPDGIDDHYGWQLENTRYGKLCWTLVVWWDVGHTVLLCLDDGGAAVVHD